MSFTLGITAQEAFYKAIGADTVDSLKLVDAEFLWYLAKMETTDYPNSFTEHYKEQFLYWLKLRKDKYIYIDGWLDAPNILVKQEYLKLLDNGLTIQQAKVRIEELIAEYERGENKLFDADRYEELRNEK